MDISQSLWISVFFLSIIQTVYLLPNNSSMKNESSTNNLIPCEEGWMLYENHCYKLFGSRKMGSLSWHNASYQCSKLGGKLASIHSKEQHDFLAVNMLLKEDGGIWIGLSDRNNNNTYVWDDGTEENFTFWTAGRPARFQNPINKTGCVVMRLGKDLYHYSAEWHDIPCSNEKPYICEKDKNETLKSVDPLFCSSEKGGGWRFRKSCYNLVINKTSWDNAEHFCQENFGGHIVTISDTKVDWFLNYQMPKFHEPTWIGIKLRNQIQQKWTSGWNVAYNIPYEILTDFSDGLCIAKHEGEHPFWKSNPCHHAYPFICETSKEHPPTLKNSLKGWNCPKSSKEWRDLGGEFCYYFDTRSRKKWREAHTECHRKGGNLASIHSKEEVEVLHPFVKHTQHSLFIGLNSLHEEHNPKVSSYTWSDKSPFDFKHWEDGKPSSAEGKCVELSTRNMKWSDVSCEERRGFICSVKKVHEARTEGHHGHCSVVASFKTLVGPICFALLMIVLITAIIYFMCPWLEEKRRNLTCRRVSNPAENDKMHLLSQRSS